MGYHIKQWRGLWFSLLLLGTMAFVSSCGNDEPSSTVVDYYLDIEEEFLINGSTQLTDRYYSPITRMRTAIRKAYPTPDAQGNDAAVVEACNKEHEEYKEMYLGEGHHFTCLFHLVRVVKAGSVVKESEPLVTYVYDINPIDVENE